MARGRSFYFYLSHMLVLSLVQAALRKIPGLNEVQPAFVFVAVVGTIGICAIGALAIEWATGRSRAAKRWIGLA